jgi:hypothetical protein
VPDESTEANPTTALDGVFSYCPVATHEATVGHEIAWKKVSVLLSLGGFGTWTVFHTPFVSVSANSEVWPPDEYEPAATHAPAAGQLTASMAASAPGSAFEGTAALKPDHVGPAVTAPPGAGAVSAAVTATPPTTASAAHTRAPRPPIDNRQIRTEDSSRSSLLPHPKSPNNNLNNQKLGRR